MTIVLTILHIVVSVFLILVVLAQQGKGQDLASAFGGGGSSAAFGARGTATLLSKITTAAAVLFMVTSLGLSYFRPAISDRSVVPETPAPEVQQPETGPGEAPGTSQGEAPPGEETPQGSESQPSGEPSEAESEQPAKGEEKPPEKKP